MIIDTFLLYSKFFLILISSLNISLYYKKDFLRVNFLLISISIFFLLYFSFLDLFVIGNILIHTFLIINFIFFLLKKQNFLNSKYFIFSIIILILSGILSPKEFLFWDEFTQWGIKPKEIFVNQSIFSDNITTNNKYWAISLYHNIILFGLNTFSEQAVILSQVFINLSGLLFIYSFIKKKNLYDLITLIIFFYFCSSIFNYGYFTIYLDVLVFLYFTCLYLLIFENNINDWENIYSIAILLSFLFLIKGISIFFGLLILFYLFLFLTLKKVKIKNFLSIIFITSTVFLSYQFLIFFSDFGFHIKPDIEYYAPKIESDLLNKYFFSALSSNNIYEGKFINFIFKIIQQLQFNYSSIYLINFKLNYYFWTILLLIFSFKISYYTKSNKHKYGFILIFVSLIIYTFFIYIAYKHYFGPAESASMSSFGRYFGIYFMFWLFVIFINIINLKLKNNNYNLSKLILVFFIVISAPGKAYENLFSVIKDFNQTHQSKIIEKKSNIKNLSNFIPKNKKILFIDQGQDEFYLRVARFITYPKRSNELCSSIVYNKEDQKQYDCLINKIEFNTILKKYDFIFFLNSNIQLIENYNLKNRLKKINNINELSLYKIIKL